jgi:hypothetical protein
MNPVWTYLFHNERPGPLALAGGVIIMGATVAHTLTPTLISKNLWLPQLALTHSANHFAGVLRFITPLKQY